MKKIIVFLFFSFIFVVAFGQKQFTTWGGVSRYSFEYVSKKNNRDMMIKFPWLTQKDPGNDWWWTEIGEVKLRKEEKDDTFPYYQSGLVEEFGVQFYHASYEDYLKFHPDRKSACEKFGMKRFIIIAYSRSFTKDFSKRDEKIYYLGNCHDPLWSRSCNITNGYINPGKSDRELVLVEIQKIFAGIYDDRGCFPPKNKEDEKNEENFRRVEKFLLSLK